MATGYTMDYSNCCRLCLSKEGRQLPFLRLLDDGLNARVLSYLSIEVSQFDDLPKEICHRCECQLNVWHYFKVDCEVSQRKLRRWHRTTSNSSSQRDHIEECDQEVIQIKQEPNDIDLHAEQYINHSEDLGSNQFSEYDVPVEGEESNENQFTGHDGESDQSCSNPERPDDLSSSFNLVISATSSMLPEENTSSHVSDSRNDGIDTVTLAANKDFDSSVDKAENEDCDTNTNEIAFVETPSQRRIVIEVNLENSNDGVSRLPGETDNHVTHQISNFADMDVSELSTGTRGSGMQDHSGDFKIKEEPEESSTEPQFYTEENNLSTECMTSINEDPQPTKKRSVKVLSVSSNAVPRRKRPRLTKQFQDSSSPVYNLNNIDLPKINNESFDENTKYCKICKKSFQNSNLWRHLSKFHVNLNPFQCGGCHKDFPGRRELVTHRVRTVSKYCRAGKEPDVDMSFIICHDKVKRGKYECRECKEKFSQLSSAAAHIRVHTGEKPFFCFKCNEKEFRLRKSAYKHVAACNGKNDTPPILSKEKRKVLSSSVAVSKVLKQKAMKPIRSKENIFKCKKCGKVFNNGVGYANHLRVECVRRCFSCSKHVPSKSFYKHFRKCLKSPANRTSEKECTSSVSSQSSTMSAFESGASLAGVEDEEDINENKNDLEEIKIRKNARITEIVDMSSKELAKKHRDKDGKLGLNCQICCKTLGSVKTMHRHLLKHCAKAFRCEICSLTMSLRSTYESHMAKFHGGHQDFSKAASSSNVRRGPSTLVKSKRSGKFPGFKLSKLKCEICLKVFSSASSLKFHKQTHKRIKCEKCEITFPSTMEKSHVCTPKIKVDIISLNQEQVALQVLPEARAVQYTCHLCKKKFHTRKMLYQHKKMHIKMKIYKCKICGNSYSDARALQQHKEDIHSIELEIPLNETDASEQHDSQNAGDTMSTGVSTNVNTQVKLWKCGVCLKEYSRMDTWSKHMKLHRGVLNTPTAIHKPQNPGVLYCSLCDKAMESQASFVRHKGWHSRLGHAELSKSPVKSESLTTSEDVVKSVSSQESGTSPPTKAFECDLCPKKFPTQKSLRIHAHYHNKDKTKDSREVSVPHSDSPQLSVTHKCEICSKTYPDLSSFSAHMNTHVAGATEAAGVSKDLTKPEIMQCELCNKEYRSKKSLKYHMMGHSGEKPYKCKSCSNQYSNPNALAKHEKERHAPILRPFCCIKCKTSFILKEDLLAHHEKCTH